MVVRRGITRDGRSVAYLDGELPIEVTNIIGLDLAERVDYTALVHVEKRQQARDPISGRQAAAQYDVQRLRRWRDVASTVIRDELADRLPAWGMTTRDQLVLDWTGAGIPVYSMYQEARLPITLNGISITSGGEPTRVPGGWHVSKRDLIAALMLVLEQHRLDIPDDLPEARVLKQELGNFRVKMTKAGHERYEAWREGDHDDLVLATALVCWFGEQPQRVAYVY